MIEEIDFEIYLYISKNEFQIFVFDKKKFKNLYNQKLKFQNNFNIQSFNSLSKFLDENIYKIEKLLGYFIKNIFLIIDDDKNLYLNIGIKKKNYDNLINHKYLKNILTELKDLFRENYQEQTIMHMVVVNYIINEKKYSSFVNNLNSENLCLEVNFISIHNNLVFILGKILENYHIKVSQYMCGNYIKSFFNEDNEELSIIANKIKNGLNDNEVILIPKNIENKGFFEKFFQLFS